MAKKRQKAGTSRAARAEKERLWVEAMIQNGGNQTQAAISAGIGPGSAAEKYGYRMSKDVRVAALLASRRAQVYANAQRAAQLTSDEVLEDLAMAKRFDPAKLYGADGRLLPVKDMPADVRLHLESVEVNEIVAGSGENRVVVGHTAKVRFPKKTAIREQAMKHFGLFEADNKQKPASTVQVGVLTVQPEALNFEKVRARALGNT